MANLKLDGEDAMSVVLDAARTAPRPMVVHRGPVYAINSAEWWSGMAELLLWADRVPVRQVTPGGAKVPIIVVRQESFRWMEGPEQAYRLTTSWDRSLRIKDSTVLYLLGALGSGVEGTCWLAARYADIQKTGAKAGDAATTASSVQSETVSVPVFAVKLYYRSAGATAEHVQNCARTFTALWGFPAQACVRAELQALAMPFFATLPACKWSSEHCDAAQRALRAMAAKKMRHTEVWPRHVGFYRTNGCLEAVLLDVGSVEAAGDDESEDALYERMTEQLQAALVRAAAEAAVS